MGLDAGLSGKDGDWDGSFGHRRALWLLRDNVLALETLVLDHLISEELCETLGSADRRRLLCAIVIQRAGHASILAEEINQLVVLEITALAVQDIDPVVCDLCHGRVAFFNGLAILLFIYLIN